MRSGSLASFLCDPLPSLVFSNPFSSITHPSWVPSAVASMCVPPWVPLEVPLCLPDPHGFPCAFSRWVPLCVLPWVPYAFPSPIGLCAFSHGLIPFSLQNRQISRLYRDTLARERGTGGEKNPRSCIVIKPTYPPVLQARFPHGFACAFPHPSALGRPDMSSKLFLMCAWAHVASHMPSLVCVDYLRLVSSLHW